MPPNLAAVVEEASMYEKSAMSEGPYNSTASLGDSRPLSMNTSERERFRFQLTGKDGIILDLCDYDHEQEEEYTDDGDEGCMTTDIVTSYNQVLGSIGNDDDQDEESPQLTRSQKDYRKQEDRMFNETNAYKKRESDKCLKHFQA